VVVVVLQNKTAITAMVQEAMTYLDSTPTPEARQALIVALRDITDGKIFVEAERARLTKLLSQIKEAEGKVDEACDILQDVHVETYGSLDKKEKADFILEQIRLTLAKKDFIRTLIISKKVRGGWSVEERGRWFDIVCEGSECWAAVR